MSTEKEVRIKLKSDTAAQWSDKNPQLYKGEIAVTTDGRLLNGVRKPRFKIAWSDGIRWKDLGYNVNGEDELDWGESHKTANNLSPIDMSIMRSLNPNRLAYYNTDFIDVEYSVDNGETWVDYEASSLEKFNLVNEDASNASFSIGGRTGDATINHKLRITFHTGTSQNIYCQFQKMAINVNTQGATNCKVKVEGRKDLTTDSWFQILNTTIAGWSSWNILQWPNNYKNFGNSDNANSREIRLTFSIGGLNPSYSNKLRIMRILAFGMVVYSYPNQMMTTGSLYQAQENQKALFPGQVECSKLITRNGAELRQNNASSHVLQAFNTAKDKQMVFTQEGKLLLSDKEVNTLNLEEGFGKNSIMAKGYDNYVNGEGSIVLGVSSSVTGAHSVSLGTNNGGSGENILAHGKGNVTLGSNCHVEGTYANIWTNYAHVIGNGTDENNRSDAYRLDWNGNAWFAGDITVGKNNDKVITESTLPVIEKPATQGLRLIKHNATTEDVFGLPQEINGATYYGQTYSQGVHYYYNNNTDVYYWVMESTTEPQLHEITGIEKGIDIYQGSDGTQDVIAQIIAATTNTCTLKVTLPASSRSYTYELTLPTTDSNNRPLTYKDQYQIMGIASQCVWFGREVLDNSGYQYIALFYYPIQNANVSDNAQLLTMYNKSFSSLLPCLDGRGIIYLDIQNSYTRINVYNYSSDGLACLSSYEAKNSSGYKK